MTLRRLSFWPLWFLPVVFVAGCRPPAPEPTGTMGAERTLFANIRAASNLSTFADALGASGLAETLSGPGPYTVFAPTDAAFDALSPELRAELTQRNSPQRTNLLAYHLVPERIESAGFGGEVRSVHGAPLYLRLEDSVATVNRRRLVVGDVPARNGVLHVIDAVLQPPGAQE